MEGLIVGRHAVCYNSATPPAKVAHTVNFMQIKTHKLFYDT